MPVPRRRDAGRWQDHARAAALRRRSRAAGRGRARLVDVERRQRLRVDPAGRLDSFLLLELLQRRLRLRSHLAVGLDVLAVFAQLLLDLPHDVRALALLVVRALLITRALLVLAAPRAALLALVVGEGGKRKRGCECDEQRRSSNRHSRENAKGLTDQPDRDAKLTCAIRAIL